MNGCYWVLQLRTRLVFHLVKAKMRYGVIRVTYIESTAAARFLLKLLRFLGILKIRLQQVEPRRNPSGPKLHLASVRNDKGEVIIFDLYHQVLKIRRQIVSEWMETYKELYYFKMNRELTGMLAAYLGMKIAAEITAPVYMAHYAKWQAYHDDHREVNGERPDQGPGHKWVNILVLPASPWNEILIPHLRELADEVHVDQRTGRKRKLRVKVAKHLAAAAAKTGILQAIRAINGTIPPVKKDARPGETDNPLPAKVTVNYRMGLLADERNDIAFYHSSALQPEQLLVFCKSRSYMPTAEEVVWLNRQGIRCYSAAKPRDKSDHSGVRVWRSSAGLKTSIKEFCLSYIKTTTELQHLGKEKKNPWLLDELWTLGMRTAFWQDFFKSNNVRILVNSIPSDTNFIPNIAMAQAGGIAVELERSIRFDYCTYIHNSPNHLYFATGPYSLTQVPEPSFSEETVQTGGINISRTKVSIEGLEKIKKKAGFVIGVFDELSNDWFFGDSIGQLYRALLDLLTSDPRFSLLIKTKKPRVLEKIGDIDEEIEPWVKTGRCIFAPWKLTPAAAAAQADFVVCVPSTAAFESVMTGTRTIIFNPMRVGSSVFYRNNGLNRRIFEESETMKAAIKRYADGTDDSIGDCRDILPFIDPFADGKGAERMGQYLRWCLQGFDAGLEREKNIAQANEKYAETWGKDKIAFNPPEELGQ